MRLSLRVTEKGTNLAWIRPCEVSAQWALKHTYCSIPLYTFTNLEALSAKGFILQPVVLTGFAVTTATRCDTILPEAHLT